jgi:CelD/BcsL family acetyltransferase involved in cellulose biosynthesis
MSVGYRVIKPTELDGTLIQAWRSILSKRDAFSSPYFCPEFTQLVGDVRDGVRVAVIENDGRPVGFLPYERRGWGSGWPVGGPLSDYHGVITESECEWDPADLLRAANLSAWTFDHLIGDTEKFERYASARAISPRIDLSQGYKQYVQARRDAGSDYIVKTEGLARKLGREAGKLSFALDEDGSEVLEHLIRWKSQQYRQASIPDAFAVSWTCELLGRIAQTRTAEFAGLRSVLRAGDRIVAVHVGMRSRDELHYWFPAYDPDFAKYSVGIILLLRIAEALASTSIAAIDLGKGDSQYKRRLMTGSREVLEGTIELRSMLSRARQVRRLAEAREARGALPGVLRLPLRAIRRLNRIQKFR